MLSSNTIIKPTGSRGRDFSPYPGEAPVVILRVQIISCHNLEAKDRNGYSDPFVVVSFSGRRFQTPVCKHNLNPVYEPRSATFDFPIYMSLVDKLGAGIEFVVWSKDIIGSSYLGEYVLPVHQWFQGNAFAFGDPNNYHFSVDLVSSRPTTTGVRGDLCIKLVFIHPPNSTSPPDFWKIYKVFSDRERVGIVVLEIYSAKDLPAWPNVTRLGWDMDPFVQVSIGDKVVGTTRVIQHTRNPVWNELLLFHVCLHDLSLPLRLTVFDRNRFTSNDYVGEVVINIATLVEWAPKKNFNTGIYPADFPGPGPTIHKFEIPLTMNPKRVYTCSPTITFRAGYHTYDSLRLASGSVRSSQSRDPPDVADAPYTEADQATITDALVRSASHHAYDDSLASVRSSWSYDPPDVTGAPYTEATGTSESESRPPLREHSRPSEATVSSGLGLENSHTSIPTSSRRPFGVTHPRFSTAPPLVKIAYSPLERLALSIEDLIASTDGASTPDANETLTSWPKLEGCLIQADIATDPLAVLAAAARDSGCQTSS